MCNNQKTEITKEEYRVIRKVFKRLGCEKLLFHNEFFCSTLDTQVTGFMGQQAGAAIELSKLAASSGRGVYSYGISEFIRSLGDVSRLLSEFQDSREDLRLANTILDTLMAAYDVYERQLEKEEEEQMNSGVSA